MWILIIVFYPIIAILFTWLFLAFIANAIGLLIQVIYWHFQDRRRIAWEQDAERAAIAYHGRYVVPGLDLDEKARLAWDRVQSVSQPLQADLRHGSR